VAARGLVVGYERLGLLPPVSLEVLAGELWAVIGPNGAGKSTFLRTLLGLQAPLGGGVQRAPGAPASYVPQQGTLDAIFPVRVFDFVLMGRLGPGRMVGPRTRSDVEAAEAALAEAGAQDLGQRLFRDLSGGQKQRVLMARAIASEARIFVLDEPTAALDIAAERAVLELIEGLRRRRGAAVVMVTHLVEDALGRADRALLLDRDHEVAVVGIPAEVRASAAFERIYGTRLGTEARA
jgi:ABC-type Mn2+/Zn2+ transport system ATPase subunit